MIKIIYNKLNLNFYIDNNFILVFIPFFAVTTLTLLVKIGFYVIALNNDKEEIENDIVIYFSDFFNNLFYLFSGLYIFVFLFLFSSIFLVIPGIIFFTYCSFFSMFLIVRKTRDGKKYGQLEAISKSFSITKGQRLKLLFFNNLIIWPILFFIFISRYSVILIGGYNAMIIIRLFLIDFVIIYLLNIGFNLEKIENEYIAEVEKKEKESKLQEIRGISNIKTKLK